MYVTGHGVWKSDSLVIFKRYYNPPGKKSWSKQHPLFKTSRPLVDPYNLGRLHPEKEWWKLPKKGLRPETFMGFPDVVNIPKHGGSLYTQLMDGPTLSMVLYRCIENDVDDIDIWKKLTLRALSLAMSLDPYIVSILFLYFSFSNYYDHRFVSTFVGRILALLDQFTLDECANVLLAMNNVKFKHPKTMDYVMRHAEVLCLSERLNVEQGLRFLSSLSAIENIPENCLIAIGEIIEVSDFGTVEETLILDALDSSCKLGRRINLLCVNKLFDEACNMLEHSKSTSHYRNLVILNTVFTFKMLDDHILNLVFSTMEKGIANCTLYELCRYLFLSGKLQRQEEINTLRNEFIKSYDKLLEDKSLATLALSGILKLSKQLTPKELKLLLEISQSLESLSKGDMISLYSSLAKYNSSLGDEFEFVKGTIVKGAWDLLDDLSPSEICCLLDVENYHLLSDVPISKLSKAFDNIMDNIKLFDRDEVITVLNFASRSDEHSKRILDVLHDFKHMLKSPKAAIALIRLYIRSGNTLDSELLYDVLDGLCDRAVKICDPLRIQLSQMIQENGIKHYTLASKMSNC